MLYIIKKKHFLADFVLQDLEHTEDCQIVDYERIKLNHKGSAFLYSIKKFIRAFIMNNKGLWLTTFFPDSYIRAIQQIDENDSVLFWGVENLKELLILQKEINTKRINVFLWNPISTINRNFYSKMEYAFFLHAKNFYVCTFDEADAKRYRFHFVNQVYRKNEYSINSDIDKIQKTDVFFVGCDKYRSRELANLLDILIQEKISYKFHILQNKHSRIIPSLAHCFTSEKLSYSETLKYIQHSKCIVEILQQGQSGMTIRTLEALFLRKKLITNNRQILNTSFYHPNNIYILDIDITKRSITDFLVSEYYVLPDEKLRPYQIEFWIKQFLVP